MTASKVGLLGLVAIAACGTGKTSYVHTLDLSGSGSGDRSGLQMQTVWTEVDEQKASSGEIGCSPEQIEIHDEEVSEGTHSWVAVCANKTYFCAYDSGNTSCTERPGLEKKPAPGEEANEGLRRIVRSTRPPSAPEPKGAAGFQLGASAEASKAACEGGGNTWEPSEAGGNCSGTPEAIGLPAQARLRFCEERLCEIVLVAQPPGTESTTWIDTFSRLSSVLENKYGKPNKEQRRLPRRCHNSFAECLSKGEVEIVYDWAWSKAVHVVLALDNATGEAAIRLRYQRLLERKAAPVEIKSDAL